MNLSRRSLIAATVVLPFGMALPKGQTAPDPEAMLNLVWGQIREQRKTRRSVPPQHAVMSPLTYASLNTAIVRHATPTTATPTISFRWGRISGFHTDPLMPDGQILLIDEDDFPAWREEMDAARERLGL
jgi:hypothetical protein